MFKFQGIGKVRWWRTTRGGHTRSVHSQYCTTVFHSSMKASWSLRGSVGRGSGRPREPRQAGSGREPRVGPGDGRASRPLGDRDRSFCPRRPFRPLRISFMCPGPDCCSPVVARAGRRNSTVAYFFPPLNFLFSIRCGAFFSAPTQVREHPVDLGTESL
jgi:hypothetical protein